jgi:hypothetical protein
MSATRWRCTFGFEHTTNPAAASSVLQRRGFCRVTVERRTPHIAMCGFPTSNRPQPVTTPH